METVIDVLPIVISVIALGISLYVGSAQVQLQKRMVKIEEERDEAVRIASQKAALTCALLRIPGNKGMRTVLRIHNDGPSAVRNVKVKINGTPLGDFPSALWEEDTIPVIGPGADYDVHMVFSLGSPSPPFHVSISWEDGTGVKDPPFETTVNW